jgi:hypothetical protein
LQLQSLLTERYYPDSNVISVNIHGQRKGGFVTKQNFGSENFVILFQAVKEGHSLGLGLLRFQL